MTNEITMYFNSSVERDLAIAALGAKGFVITKIFGDGKEVPPSITIKL